MVAVTLQFATHGLEEALLRVRRIGETPRGISFLIDHQAEPVAVIKLARRGLCGNETHAVVPHRLHVLEVAILKLGRGGIHHRKTARHVVPGMSAFEEDPFPVECEPPIHEAEITESETRRVAIDRKRVDVRRIDTPELEARHIKRLFKQGVSRRQLARAHHSADRVRRVVSVYDEGNISLAWRA